MSDLKQILKLAGLLVTQKARYEELEEQAKEAKKLYLATEREDLPDFMTELGLKELTLEDGSKVSLVEEVSTSITAKTRDAAMRWLVDNKFGGLIKVGVGIEFSRGDREAAQKVYDELALTYASAYLKEDVHSATLKSFVKEQMAAGNDVPMDIFNIHPYKKATLKRS